MRQTNTVVNCKNDLSPVDLNSIINGLVESYRTKHWSWGYMSSQSYSFLLLASNSINNSNYIKLSNPPASFEYGTKKKVKFVFESRTKKLTKKFSVSNQKDAKLWLSVEGCYAKINEVKGFPDDILLNKFVELSPPHFQTLGIYFPVLRLALKDAINAIVIYNKNVISVFIGLKDLEIITKKHEYYFRNGTKQKANEIKSLITIIGDKTELLLSEINSSLSDNQLFSILQRLEFLLETLGLTSLRLNDNKSQEQNITLRQKRRKIIDNVSNKILESGIKKYLRNIQHQFIEELMKLDLINDTPRVLFKDGFSWIELGRDYSVNFLESYLKNDYNFDEKFEETGYVSFAPKSNSIIGNAKVINILEDFSNIKEGDVIVVGDFPTTVVEKILENGVEPLAVISQEGGISCHASIECRENKWPCIVGVDYALTNIRSGWKIKIDVNRYNAKIIAGPNISLK